MFRSPAARLRPAHAMARSRAAPRWRSRTRRPARLSRRVGFLPFLEQGGLLRGVGAGLQLLRIQELRRRLVLRLGVGDELLADAAAPLDLAREPSEDRADSVGRRAELEPRPLRALVAPAVEAGVLAFRRVPDREGAVLAA